MSEDDNKDKPKLRLAEVKAFPKTEINSLGVEPEDMVTKIRNIADAVEQGYLGDVTDFVFVMESHMVAVLSSCSENLAKTQLMLTAAIHSTAEVYFDKVCGSEDSSLL